ncbi:MAG: hypothetical protein PHP23_09370, partial [Desulfobacterales bacterium]|nr:hypothetical protein [Desulfobacterales bacterium]
MRIVILHQAVTEHSSLDERDVLMQVDAVSEALKSLGHEPTAIACDLNLSALRNTLKAMKPDAVFNLVESLDGSGRFLHLAPCLMEAMNTAFTGCPATALLTTSHKTMAKSVMAHAGLPTPAWIGPCPQDSSSHIGDAALVGHFDTDQVLAGNGRENAQTGGLQVHAHIGLEA